MARRSGLVCRYQFLVELKTVHIQWTQRFPVVALENFISNLTFLCLTRSFNGFTHLHLEKTPITISKNL